MLLIILPAALLLLGIGCLGYGIWRLQIDLRPALWAKVMGRVIRCEMISHRIQHGTHHVAEITIAYEYANEVLCRTVYPYCVGNIASAESVMMRYPKHLELQIFVLKTKPRIIRLEPGIDGRTGLILAFGIFCLAAFWLFHYLKNAS